MGDAAEVTLNKIIFVLCTGEEYSSIMYELRF